MNPRPLMVEPLDDFELLITFKNGESKIYDVKPLLELPIYQRLTNKGFFDTVKVDNICICWNDDIDLCPDMVYEESREVNKEQI